MFLYEGFDSSCRSTKTVLTLGHWEEGGSREEDEGIGRADQEELIYTETIRVLVKPLFFMTSELQVSC